MGSEKLLYFCNLLLSRLINAGKSSRSIQPTSILCVKLDEIGDMATALGVFSALKKSFPASSITVLCKPFAGSLLRNNPHVDRVIYRVEDWNEAFDLVVELRGTWQTLRRSLHPRYWPGYRLDRGWIRFKQRGQQPHEQITNYRIVEPVLRGANQSNEKHRTVDSSTIPADWLDIFGGNNAFVFPSEEDWAAAELWVSQAERAAFTAKGEAPSGLVILHAGARKMLRQWPLENFAFIAKWLWDNHRLWSIWVGTAEEKESLQSAHTPELGTLWISEEAQPQNTSLSAFYALISKANLFIGNESGPLQLASLSGVPVLGLFGPGVERVFYPWGSDVIVLNALGEIVHTDSTSNANQTKEGYPEQGKCKNVVIHCLLDCNPCDQVHCIHPDNPCMRRISIHQVVAILQNQFFTQ